MKEVEKMGTGRIKKAMTTESALILEALLAIVLLYYFGGFEKTVLATLGVIAGHVVKMSWKLG